MRYMGKFPYYTGNPRKMQIFNGLDQRAQFVFTVGGKYIFSVAIYNQ